MVCTWELYNWAGFLLKSKLSSLSAYNEAPARLCTYTITFTAGRNNADVDLMNWRCNKLINHWRPVFCVSLDASPEAQWRPFWIFNWNMFGSLRPTWNPPGSPESILLWSLPYDYILLLLVFAVSYNCAELHPELFITMFLLWFSVLMIVSSGLRSAVLITGFMNNC